MNFNSRIRELRIEKGLTRLDLAAEIGVSGSALGNYERGERSPDSELITKLADFFNVTSDYLLGKSEFRVPKEIQQHDKNLSGLKAMIDDCAALGADRFITALNDFLSNAVSTNFYIFGIADPLILNDATDLLSKWGDFFTRVPRDSCSADEAARLSKDSALIRLYETADECRRIILENGKEFISRIYKNREAADTATGDQQPE